VVGDWSRPVTRRSNILIERLEIYGYHGLFGAEKNLGQRFTLDLALTVDLSAASVSDALEDTVDYAAVVAVASKTFSETRHNLLEAAARSVAQAIFAAFPPVESLSLTLRKLSPPIPANLRAVGVSLDFRRNG
jgi:dihydroneopterin aldolase